MKTRRTSTGQACFLAMALGYCVFPDGAVLAQGAPKKAATATATQPTPVTAPVAAKVRFVPAVTGVPSVRVTGGSRGTGEATVVLDVLTPDDVGLTTQEQPSLFWYQSKPTNARFELSLLEDKKVAPLLHIRLDHAGNAGIQRLKLSDHGVHLAVGVEYQWVVALVTDPDNRSTDLVASGVIKRIAPPTELAGKVSQASEAALPEVYAQSGIWYDTLSTLSDQVEARPSDRTLRETRSELLRQVGLKAAAGAELAVARTPAR